MSTKLSLPPNEVEQCYSLGKSIADTVTAFAGRRTTVSIERSILRLLGIDGADGLGIPIPNRIVELISEPPLLSKGILYWLANGMIATNTGPDGIAAMIQKHALNLVNVPQAPLSATRDLAGRLAEQARRALFMARERRGGVRNRFPRAAAPLKYALTATGNVYEDVVHSQAAANAGADIIAMIRSTAQSLLDYVPFGPTTEGYGGTFATQANFRIVRKALDDWSENNNRYVQLSSFSSGLCMPEIATMGAIEGLDNMVNDALYGILYRDINMVRTLVDQHISREILGIAGIVINTGEDNYLRTADAISAAPSVVASQIINYHLARNAGLKDDQIAIGNAFEINPDIENGLLVELAHAQLTRELFPFCLTKYMPPTRHMNGNIFRTHACDSMFNLVTVVTRQSMQTVGVPTEGIHTPHIQDRTLGLQNSAYVFRFAHDLADEITFVPDGKIRRRALEVLRSAVGLLERIKDIGLFAAIGEGIFGDVSRSSASGRGAEGVVELNPNYYTGLR